MSQLLGHHYYLQLPVFRFTNELLDCTSRDYREYKTADRWRSHTLMCLGCCQLRSWWEWPCYSCCRNIPPRIPSFSYLRWWPPLDFEKCRVMLGKVVLKEIIKCLQWPYLWGPDEWLFVVRPKLNEGFKKIWNFFFYIVDSPFGCGALVVLGKQ